MKIKQYPPLEYQNGQQNTWWVLFRFFFFDFSICSNIGQPWTIRKFQLSILKFLALSFEALVCWIVHEIETHAIWHFTFLTAEKSLVVNVNTHFDSHWMYFYLAHKFWCERNNSSKNANVWDGFIVPAIGSGEYKNWKKSWNRCNFLISFIVWNHNIET